jgi:hypothetical protein
VIPATSGAYKSAAGSALASSADELASKYGEPWPERHVWFRVEVGTLTAPFRPTQEFVAAALTEKLVRDLGLADDALKVKVISPEARTNEQTGVQS